MLFLEPLLPFITMEASSVDVFDVITIAPQTDGQNVGIYDVKVKVMSTSGYMLPSPGRLPTLEYPLKVTVNPCEITSITKSNDQVISYEIGKDSKTTSPYSFAQQPDCKYTTRTLFTVTPNQPPWLVHNEDDKTFTINKFTETNYPERYDIQVKHQVDTITDPANPTQITTVESIINIRINIILPCIATDLKATKTLPDPVEYTLGQDPIQSSLSFLFEFTRSKSGCSFPGEFELTGVPSMIDISPATSSITIAKSFDLTQRGVYPNGKVLARLTDDGTGNPLEAFFTFTTNVYPCPINQFTTVPGT